MSPSTVGKQTRKRNPLHPLPTAYDLIARSPMLLGPIAYIAADIADRMLVRRRADTWSMPFIEHHRAALYDDELFPNVAAMERAFGLLNTAPLSAEQASQEAFMRNRRNTP